MKTIYTKYKLLIPVSIMTVLCIWSVFQKIFGFYEYNGVSYHYGFSFKHYIAFTAVVLSWIIFFTIKPILKYVLSLTLILGNLNILSFTISTYWIGYSVFKDDISIGISFQPVSLIITLLTYLIFFKEINSIIARPFRLNAAQKEAMQEAEINRFKERYSDYNDESLNTILEEKKYMQEALEAARQILNERSKRNN